MPNTHEESRKNQSVTKWYGCGKCGVMETNIECLCCCQVEAVEYFKLSNVGCGDMSPVTQKSLNLPVK